MAVGSSPDGSSSGCDRAAGGLFLPWSDICRQADGCVPDSVAEYYSTAVHFHYEGRALVTYFTGSGYIICLRNGDAIDVLG